MKTKSIKERIKEYFFLNPTEKLRVRQIERIVGVPLPSAIRYVKELEDEGIIKSSVVSGVKFFSSDRTSKTFLVEKRAFNLNSLEVSGLKSYLVDEFSNPAIVLFGSYSRGEDIEKSDIDLYIETSKKECTGLSRYEKILQRKIQFFFYKNINDVENKELANNILNGITVNGFMDVF
ncbi:hypothetical protein GQ473_00790 [archaeon]|nr:hypothetical protein [archaeon]